MYNKIFNPTTGRHVSIYSKLGQSVINNYLIQSGGTDFAGFKHGFLIDKKEKIKIPKSKVKSALNLVERYREGEVNFDSLPPELKNYIIQFLDDTNQDENIRISNKCKNIVRYCQANVEMNRYCKNTPSIRQTIGECKQHKVYQIKNSRPFRISVGIPIDTVPKGKPVSQPKSMAGSMNLKSKLGNIENRWQLSKSLSVPLSLHRVADLLNVPKYCYISTTTGYVFETDDDNPSLPKYGKMSLPRSN